MRENVINALIDGYSLRTVHIPTQEPSEAKAEGVIRGMPKAPPIAYGRLRTINGCYDTVDDQVWIHPSLKGKKERFRVTFHELAHSTGHRKRLNRPGFMSHSRVRDTYCREEILAELSSLYLSLEVGMFRSHAPHAAWYFKHFLGLWGMKSQDERASVLLPIHAEAQKVVNFILKSTGAFS